MKTKFLLPILTVAVLSFNSCKKDDDSNLQPKGNYGNANVSSASYTGNWIFQGGSEWDVTLNVPAITSSVLSSASINTYLSGDGGQSWIALPVYISPVSIAVVYQVNTVGVAAQGGSSAPSATLFKVVIISAAGRKANPNLDLKNYNAVKTAFNLKD